jgi:hypothetical protein
MPNDSMMPHLGQAIAAIHIAQLGLAIATSIRWVEFVSRAEDPGRPLTQTTVEDKRLGALG